MTSLIQRMIRAAKLDTNLYEEVEVDRKAMGQAMLVVVISSIAAGIGVAGSVSVSGMIMTSISALISWYIWAYLTYFIGTRLLPEPQTHADHGQLLRTLGFAASPGLIQMAGIIPGLGRLTILIGSIWMLVATVIAVRQALDYSSTGRAIGVCIIGWFAQVFIRLVMRSFFGN